VSRATTASERRRPGRSSGAKARAKDVVLIVSFGEPWRIDGERLTSFVAGLRDRQVTTRHEGRCHGIHVNVSPPAAFRLLGLPLHELAYRQVPLEDVLPEPLLAERLHDAGNWDDRFRLLDCVLARRLSAARQATPARPDWARIAVDAGYYDQSHLINEFRAFSGRTPETFFQDAVLAAA
jgi:AraC-like DNA-binding protein